MLEHCKRPIFLLEAKKLWPWVQMLLKRYTFIVASFLATKISLKDAFSFCVTIGTKFRLKSQKWETLIAEFSLVTEVGTGFFPFGGKHINSVVFTKALSSLRSFVKFTWMKYQKKIKSFTLAT